MSISAPWGNRSLYKLMLINNRYMWRLEQGCKVIPWPPFLGWKLIPSLLSFLPIHPPFSLTVVDGTLICSHKKWNPLFFSPSLFLTLHSYGITLWLHNIARLIRLYSHSFFCILCSMWRKYLTCFNVWTAEISVSAPFSFPSVIIRGYILSFSF